LGTERAVPRLCKLYPGICLTTEEKTRKNFSQGSQRVPFGMMRTEYSTVKTELAVLFIICDNLHGSSGVAQPLQLKQNEYSS
jgi:hypothetical protein